MTGTTPSVYHPAASDSKRSGPEAFGRLLRVSGDTAWFQHGELRGEPLGPVQPERESWWEPVLFEGELEALARSGREVVRGLPSILGPVPIPAVGWVLVEAEERYVVDCAGFARILDRATREEASSLEVVHRFIARAVAYLAPETPARSNEVQKLLGVRAERVRRARPASVSRQRPFAAVGLWLDRLNPGGVLAAGTTAAAKRVRSASPPTVRPLGGPVSEELS